MRDVQRELLWKPRLNTERSTSGNYLKAGFKECLRKQEGLRMFTETVVMALSMLFPGFNMQHAMPVN